MAERVGFEALRTEEYKQELTLRLVRRYLTSMKTTVSSKGQIVLPAEFRQMDRIEAGQEFDIERLDRGEYRLVRRRARPNDGAVDWLLACPEKGYFVPVESESTDTL
jgi:AbrB family looped-hinge helix DNA binding protein